MLIRYWSTKSMGPMWYVFDPGPWKNFPAIRRCLNWARIRCEATQFAVAATSHRALSSDEMRSTEVRWGEMNGCIMIITTLYLVWLHYANDFHTMFKVWRLFPFFSLPLWNFSSANFDFVTNNTILQRPRVFQLSIDIAYCDNVNVCLFLRHSLAPL